MTVTLVLPDSIADEIAHAANKDVEVAGVLVASPVEAPNGDLRLLGNKMEWVEANAYLRQESDGLLIASHGYVPTLAEAERRRGLAIWLHTHPGQDGEPLPSNHDFKACLLARCNETAAKRTQSNAFGGLVMVGVCPERTTLRYRRFRQSLIGVCVHSGLRSKEPSMTSEWRWLVVEVLGRQQRNNWFVWASETLC
jgi:proteasome lid subunit RPN8/RPN11